MDHIIEKFVSAVHNRQNAENIPKDAAQDEKNFINKDGRIILSYGTVVVGGEASAGQVVRGHWFGYTVNGTKIHYKKAGTKIQYLNGTTWTDVITGLDAADEYSFANYSSLAGAFTFINGKGGYWKINSANPASAMSMYNSAKNFHGKILIDRGRTILWDRQDTNSKDPTGFYGSKIDRQNSTIYNSKASEVLGASGSTHYTGTLALKKTSAFTVTIASPGVFTLNGHGFLAGDKVVFATTGALPTGLTAGTIYYVIAAGLTANAFEVSTTLGGTAVDTSGSQSGTHTLVAATRNVFGLAVTGTTAAGVETFHDNYDGTLTSDKGGTGTINYATGAFDITFNASVSSGSVLGSYQWEDSNIGGLTDFTKSGTRLAGEGFQFPQDEGGDAILVVLIGQDGAYYSFKKNSVYRLAIADDDLNAENLVYRKDIGIPNWRAAVSTSRGIVFMNTANPDKPELTILTRNPLGDSIEPVSLFEHFKFANYVYDDCVIETHERFFAVACKSTGADNNDRILLCNPNAENPTVNVTGISARTLIKSGGLLYGGSPFSGNVYQLFDGFDDDGSPIDNYWISKDETYSELTNRLKKYRKQMLNGLIGQDQVVQVYANYDSSGFELIGTIRGDGSYVDYGGSQAIGNNLIGESLIGGDVTAYAFPYFFEIKMPRGRPKFRKRSIKLVATEVGYFDVEMIGDMQITVFEQRIPKRFRLKQNVSLDGVSTNQ